MTKQGYRGEDVLRERVRAITVELHKNDDDPLDSPALYWNLACDMLAHNLKDDGLNVSSGIVLEMKK